MTRTGVNVLGSEERDGPVGLTHRSSGELLREEQGTMRGIAIQWPKIGQPVGDQGLAYGVLQQRLMYEDPAGEHHR